MIYGCQYYAVIFKVDYYELSIRQNGRNIPTRFFADNQTLPIGLFFPNKSDLVCYYRGGGVVVVQSFRFLVQKDKKSKVFAPLLAFMPSCSNIKYIFSYWYTRSFTHSHIHTHSLSCKTHCEKIKAGEPCTRK